MSERETDNTEEEGEQGAEDGRDVDGEVDGDPVQDIPGSGAHRAETQVRLETGGRSETRALACTKQLVRETCGEAVQSGDDPDEEEKRLLSYGWEGHSFLGFDKLQILLD